MSAQMERHGDRHEEEQHPPIHCAGLRSSGVEGGEQHEKKSVLKKVKAKAKKIKDTITKHGHGHGRGDGHGHAHDRDRDHAHDHHHHHHRGGHTDEEEEDYDSDDVEEMEEDKEVHGAPIYESKEVRSYVPGKGAPPIQGDVMLGGGHRPTTAPAPLAVERHGKDVSDANSSINKEVYESKEVRTYVPGQGAASIQRDVVLGVGNPTPTVTAPVAAGDLGTDISDVNSIMSRQGHELKDYRSFIPEQVGVSKHNGITFGGSQTKPVAAGSGTQIAVGGAQKQSLGYDTSAHGTNLPLSSGMGLQQQGAFNQKTGIFDRPTSLESDTHSPRVDRQPDNYQPLGYKTSAHETNLPLSSGMGLQQPGVFNQKTAVFDRPTSLESDPHSPRGNCQPTSLESDPHSPRGNCQPDNYQSKVKDPTGRGGEEIGVTPILHSLDKMAIYTDETKQRNAKTRIGQQESLFKENTGLADEDQHSLLSGTGSHDQFLPEPKSDATSLFSLYPETERELMYGAPMEQDIGESGSRQHGASYADKVSSATSVIADKAIQAKNVVASKLGYGGEYDDQKSSMPSREGEVEAAGKTPSVTDYGKKVASTVQAKLGPVYDKVAGVGSAVMPKMQGSPTTEDGMEGSIYDKGVSPKEYIAEKVSPGEEDKALSEVISGALHKDTGREDEKKEGPKGKVTISAKVARQLGRGDERSVEELGSGGAGPGETVVELLRGTVTSWLGMGGGKSEPSTVVFHDIPKEANEESGGHKLQQGQGTDGERRLQ